jgi:hypothetical protein
MKKIFTFLFILMVSREIWAQTASITGTVTDSDGQLWLSGTWGFEFYPNPNYPNLSSYYVGNVPLTQYYSVPVKGNIDPTAGTFTMSNMVRNDLISPSGSRWTLKFCPNASSACGAFQFTLIVNSVSSPAFNAIITQNITAPRFSAVAGSYGYNDTEAGTVAVAGATYWNVLTFCQRYYSNSPPIGWGCPSNPGGTGISGNTPGFSVIAQTSSTSTQSGGLAEISSPTWGATNAHIAGFLASSYCTSNPVCVGQIDTFYGNTEAQPFGGANSGFYAHVPTGPKSTDPISTVVDYRTGVPQYLFNSAPLFDNRHPYWPSYTMNFVGQAGLNGTYINGVGALSIVTNWYTGTRSFYNDKFDSVTLQVIHNSWAEVQGGGSIGHGVNCYGLGDCVSYTNDAFYAGSSTQSDEGLELFRHSASELGYVFHATINATPTVNADGSVLLTTSVGSQVAGGTQGEGRPIIITTPAKIYNTGYISAFNSNSNTDETVTCAGGCAWDSTFGTSTKTTLSIAVANPGSNNTFPQTNVTITVASSTGFTVGNIACIFDYAYECQKITAVATGTITFSVLRYPHPIGSYVTTGGLAGYGIEFEADRVDPNNMNGMSNSIDQSVVQLIRAVYPIMYSSSGNIAYLFQGGNTLPGAGSGYTGRAYPQMSGSGATCSVTVTSGAVTAGTFTGGSGYGIPTVSPPQIVISGITSTTAPVLYYNGTSSLSIFNAGAGIAGTPTCTVVTSNPYDIYQQAKTIQVYNTTLGQVDGSFKTDPWKTTPANGDTIEQPHGTFMHVAGDGIYGVGQYIPSLGGAAHGGGGIYFSGSWQGNDTLMSYTMGADHTLFQGFPAPVNIIGRGQWIPPIFTSLAGQSVRQYFSIDTPPFASNFGYNPSIIHIGCGGISCLNWTSPYFMESASGWNPTTSSTYTGGWIFTPSADILQSTWQYLDLSPSTIDLGYPSITSSGGFVSQQGQNWNPFSNVLTNAVWNLTGTGTTVTQDATIADPYGGSLPVWKVANTGTPIANVGIYDTTTTNFSTGPSIVGNVWVRTTTGTTDICINVANASGNCVIPLANTWTRLQTITPPATIPNINNRGSNIYIPNQVAGTFWLFNPVAEAGIPVSTSALINPTATSVTTPQAVTQVQGSMNIMQTLTINPNLYSVLPACSASFSGRMASISDPSATPTYWTAAAGTGTAGATSAPVYCDGVTWRYH